MGEDNLAPAIRAKARAEAFQQAVDMVRGMAENAENDGRHEDASAYNNVATALSYWSAIHA